MRASDAGERCGRAMRASDAGERCGREMRARDAAELWGRVMRIINFHDSDDYRHLTGGKIASDECERVKFTR